jgi:hypothetical protein
LDVTKQKLARGGVVGEVAQGLVREGAEGNGKKKDDEK